MVTKSPNGSLRSIVKALAAQSLRGASDPELLRKFVKDNDEAAFRVIAERHGPMVLGVCRRALHCAHDADDAFQATFLVFARKAATIRKSASLGSWLHGVALRIAAKIQRERTRRQRREQSARTPAVATPVDALTWAEVKCGLDEEMQRLPAQYREVLILCYLEAKTRDEAAQQLGLKVGTVHGRLERGRKLLAERLSKRGLMLSAGLVAVAVAPDTLAAAVRAGSLFAAQTSLAAVISPRVLSLTNEFLKGMTMTKTKVLVATLIVSVVLITGVGFTTAQAPATVKIGEPTIKTASTALGLPIESDAIVLYLADESDEAFIRRISKDLRGSDPTPTEVHFFVRNRDAKKRETLIDLFVKERQEKKEQAEAQARAVQRLAAALEEREERRLHDIQQENRSALQLTKTQFADPELALLRTKVELAKITVEEKSLLLKIAEAEKAPAAQIEQKKLDLEKARLALKEAELNLSIAEKKHQKPIPPGLPPAKKVSSGSTPGLPPGAGPAKQ